MRSAFTIQAPSTAAIRALNYSPYLEVFRRKQRGLNSIRLGELLKSMGTAYGSVFIRRDCDPTHGVELISQTDMFNAEPAGRVIRIDSMANPERHRVQKWQVLIAGAGTLGETELYGRSIIADDRLADKFVGPDAMALTFEDPGSRDNLFAYAFLCSRVGVSLVRSTSYGTKILRLKKEVLADLRIPDPGSDVKDRVADLIRRTVEQREIFVRELTAARAIIESLPEMRYALAQCGERKARCVLWRSDLPTLGAWNLASTGGGLAYLQEKWKARLGDVLAGGGVFNGHRFARVACSPPHGIDFYSQRDVFLMRAVPRRIVHPKISDELLYLPEGAIVAGGQGTLGEGEIFGRVAIVSGRLARSGISEHLLRIVTRPEESMTIFTYLSTYVGFRMLRSTGVGTKLLGMRKDLLRRLPIPDLGHTQSRSVKEHIVTAMSSRNSADAAEDEAVRIIEQEVLPSWLS